MGESSEFFQVPKPKFFQVPAESPTIRRELEIFPVPLAINREEKISKFFLVGSYIEEKYEEYMKNPGLI